MKKLILLTLLIGVLDQSNAQTDFPINTVNLPNGWQLGGTARVNSQFGRTDTYSIQIEDELSSLTTNNLNNVNLFQFFARSPQNMDDFDVVIDYSVDGINWIPQSTILMKSDPAKSTIDNPNDFKAFSISWNKPGGIKFRFKIKKRSSNSVLILDDFSFVGMTVNQTNQYVTNENLNIVTATIREEIMEQVAYANFNLAQNRFTEAADNAKKNIHLVANLIDKSSGIYLIGGIGDKIAIRNQMVNPWSYDKFKDFVTKIESKLPAVKKNNLLDIVNIIKAPLQLADKVLLGGSLSAFGSSIKALIGDAFTKTNLKEMGISSSDINGEITNGLDVYSKVKTFLEVIIKENDKANFLNLTIFEVAKDSELLMKDSEKQLLIYLEFIKMPNPEQEILNLKTDRINTINRIDKAVNSFYNSQIGLPQNFANNSKLTPLQNSVLSRTVTLSTDAKDLRKRYPALTSKMTSFLNNLKNDSQAPNPFQTRNAAGVVTNLIDDTTTEKWGQFKTDLGTGLDNLISKFSVTYVQYNLYD